MSSQCHTSEETAKRLSAVLHGLQVLDEWAEQDREHAMRHKAAARVRRDTRRQNRLFQASQLVKECLKDLEAANV